MYNTDLPTRAELPSSKQLLRSTSIAIAVAAALLVSVVMPSEYGIDPTGIGNALGLKQMGEIKQSLAAEAAQDALVPTAPQVALAAPAAPPAPIVQPAPPAPAAPVLTPASPETVKVATKADQMQVILKPGEAAEIKLDMRKGATVNYVWSAKGGPVNVDAHGDPYDAPKGFYHGYGKDRQINGKDGILEAAFDGKHGWFWRNRSKSTVTITLKTDGDYQSIKRVV